jgi:hypothetical protein
VLLRSGAKSSQTARVLSGAGWWTDTETDMGYQRKATQWPSEPGGGYEHTATDLERLALCYCPSPKNDGASSRSTERLERAPLEG